MAQGITFYGGGLVHFCRLMVHLGPEAKVSKILSQIRSVSSLQKVPVKELQSLVGRLLWLTSAWHYLRPLLIPLYKALHRLAVTMNGMDHIVFKQLHGC